MSLYILSKNNTILAICEYQTRMIEFCLQTNFTRNNGYSIDKITNPSKIDRYLIRYDDLYLIEYYDGAIIRAGDCSNIKTLVYYEMDSIMTTIQTLHSILSNPKLPDNSGIILTTAIYEIEHHFYRDIERVVNIRKLIREYYGTNIYEYLKDLSPIE